MPEKSPFTPYVCYAISLICLAQLFNQADRAVVAALLPMIKGDFALTDGQLGLLNLPFSLFYAICGIPIAWWADRGVRRDIIAIAVAVWSVMTALSGVVQNYLQFFFVRIGVGAGEAGSFAPGGSLLCDYVPLERRTLALAVFAFANAAGALVGLPLSAWLGETMGWRWAFIALGLPGLVLALVMRLTLHEPRRGASDARTSSVQNTSFASTLSLLWRCRTYRRLVTFLVLNGFAISALGSWWPTFYTRLFGLGLTTAGLSVGIVFGICGGTGILIGGVIASKLAREESSRSVQLCAVANVIAFLMLATSLFVSSVSASLILIAIGTLLYSCSNAPVLATLYSVVPAAMRATAGAVAVFLITGVGAGISSLAVGYMSDALAPTLGQEALRYALLLPVAVFALTVVPLLLAAQTLVNDLRAVGALAAVVIAPAERVA